ncbi:MAG: hypothetical protein LBR64_09260 [Dysgonamonadaceae bacterium]|jgi:hypothetical protein|nr:hypothetical protein [Dysgonamonadaceae bacterium]
MIRRIKFINIAAFALLALFSLPFFSSCEKEEALNTAQEKKLNAFGPSPALRGGELTFIGVGINQVTKVILPENIEVTDIRKIDNEHIKITIPQEAQPGYVKLIFADGTEITTTSQLSFTEPITIESIEPSPVKAGQTVTIKGDYLNLINLVVLSKSDTVSEFTAHDRQTIQFVLPETAQTGVVILSNGAQIPIEVASAEELQIVLPSVPAPADLTGKKPGDAITIAGENLDLVRKVLMPDGSEVNFIVAPDGKSITFTLPENSTDGAVVMIPASQVQVALANIGMAVPQNLTVSPATGLKPGDIITITGVNMELVTNAVFAGVADPVALNSKSATEIKITMPAAAVSGEVTLNTASGKTAVVTIETAKPEALSYNPNPVSAGSELTISGHDLDLVASLAFGGGVSVDVTAENASTIKVQVPTTAESGTITATMKNGETVDFPSLTVDKPVCAYIPVMPEGEIKGGDVFIVDLENADKLTGVQINGQAVQYVLSGTKLYVGIPANAYGNCTLKLVSSNGEIEYAITVKPGGTVETVIWDSGPLSIGWGDGALFIPAEKFNNVEAGTYMKLYFQQTDNWGQAQINNGAWAGINFPEIGGTTITTNTYDDKTVTTQELKLTADILDNIRANAAGWGIIIQGQDWIFTKVTLVKKAKIETVVSSTPHDLSWGNPLAIDKSVLQGLKGGSTWLRLYYTATGSIQVALSDANWSKLNLNDPNFDSQWQVLNLPQTGSVYDIELSAANLATALSVNDGWSNNGILITGPDGTGTINKVAIVTEAD